ncbi:MAG TPA: SpoIIE family protein phosphatase [Pirellulales bacterium]
MAVLQVLKGLNPGQQFPLEREEIILGRHPDCDVVLEMGAVSRQHARITRVGGAFFVEDLGSRNKTYLNGTLVETPTQLSNNDRVKICDMLFAFHAGDAAPPPATIAPTVSAQASALVGAGVGGPSSGGSVGLGAEDLKLEEEQSNPTSTVMGTLNLTESGHLNVAVRPEAKLKALIEITTSLARVVKLEDVFPKILESLFKVFSQADRGFILVLEKDKNSPTGEALIPKAARHRRGQEDGTVRISKTIANNVITECKAILSADAISDSRFDMSQSVADFRIRSMMCVPMLDSEGKALGLIQVDTQDQQQRFEQDDLDVLAAVAHQAGLAIENGKLHQAEKDKEKLERDLDFARKVQQGFLPSAPPKAAGYEFFDFYRPAKHVGGDYFDYIHLPNDRLAIVLADVSGKGVAAALLMAKLSSEVRFHLAMQADVSTAVFALNQAFCSGGWEDRFVTMVMFVVDLRSHQVTLLNAGHMPPMLRRTDGRIEEIDAETSLPLGVAEGMEYGAYTFSLAPGESLTIYTDGFSEAMNANRDLYGIERLKSVLSGKQGKTVGDFGTNVLADVQKFTGDVEQSDDMCIVSFGRSRG